MWRKHLLSLCFRTQKGNMSNNSVLYQLEWLETYLETLDVARGMNFCG